MDSPASLRPEDLEWLTRQLGRRPRGAQHIEVRCPAGHPLVAQVYPWIETKSGRAPFPTLFWLSCPVVSAQIARLEAQGWIPRLEAEIAANPALRDELRADHRRYAEERWRLLERKDQQHLCEKGWDHSLREAGIGGIRQHDHLKCLHAHHAFHLARGGLIGRLLEERFPFSTCPKTCPET